MKLNVQFIAALDKCHSIKPLEQINFAAIAREFGICRTTLSRRYRAGSTANAKKNESKSGELLDEAQRHLLLERLWILARRGLYPTPAILRNLAGEIAGRRPGHNWPSRFLKKYGADFKSVVIQGMEPFHHTAEYRPVFEDYFNLVRQKSLL